MILGGDLGGFWGFGGDFTAENRRFGDENRCFSAENWKKQLSNYNYFWAEGVSIDFEKYFLWLGEKKLYQGAGGDLLE